jgi:DNA-binding LacI/PurR family transcriptional regulator
VAINEHWAAMLWKHLAGRGIKVPEEVSIAAQDRIEHLSYSLPLKLTSTRRNREALGKTAFNLLLAGIMSGAMSDKKPHYIDLPVEFFRGESCVSRESPAKKKNLWTKFKN